MIETIIFDNNRKFVKRLADSISEGGDLRATTVSSGAEAEQAVGENGAAILVIGPSTPLANAVALAQKLAKTHPHVGSILVTDNITTELLQSALRAGFRDVTLNQPAEIAAALSRARETIPPVGTAQADARKPDKARRGRIITFFSTKGGVGKTVFATNTAVGLARQNDDPVLLVDFDHQFGDVGVMLGLKPERTISDLLPAIDRVDADMLGGFLTRHETGLSTLLAPVRHDMNERLSQLQLQKLLEAARSSAEFVIIDTPGSFVENNLTILDKSDCICIVTTLDVPSVKNTQIALQTLGLLNYPEEKIKVLLNRADSKVSLLPAEVERHLKHKIAVQIPSSLAVPRSVNEGRPVLLEDSQSPIANALKQIVSLAMEVKQTVGPAHSLSEAINEL